MAHVITLIGRAFERLLIRLIIDGVALENLRNCSDFLHTDPFCNVCPGQSIYGSWNREYVRRPWGFHCYQ